MEEAIAEKLTLQELQINQRHDGSVAPSDTECPEEPSHNGYAKRETNMSRNHVPSDSFEGSILLQDRGRRSVCRDFNRGHCPRGKLCAYEHILLICRDFIRGSCTYGETCKFWHPDSNKHDGKRSYDNENFGNSANLENSRFGGGNKDDNLRCSFPREHKSTAPCWKFQSGRCFLGADCAYSHSDNDTIDPNAQPNFGKYRSRSPCRNFLRGRCYNGANCRRLHIENTGYVRPENDGTSHHQEVTENLVNHKCDEEHVDVSLRASQENNKANKDLRNDSIHREPRSRSPCRKFLRGSCLRGSCCPYIHDISQENNEVNKDSRNDSIHREPRSRSPCRKFLRGSCLRGSSCPYIHDMDLDSRNKSSEGHKTRTYGEFGNDKQIKEFCLKFGQGRCDRGDSCRYLHSFHEYAKSNPVPNKKHHEENIKALGSSDGAHCHVGNGSCLSEDIHTANDSASNDGAFNEQSKRPAVGDSSKPDVSDQKEEPQVIDRKGEVDDDVSLWSQPFKRPRRWSESLFANKEDFSCRSLRRDESQNNFTRGRNYLVPFQYHHRGSYHRSWPQYHLDNRPRSKVTTSTDLPSRQFDKDSDTKIPNRNGESELAKDDLQHSNVEKGDAPSGNLPSDSHLTNSQVVSNGMGLEKCGACSLDSNNSILHQKIDISQDVSTKEVEFDSTSPEYGTSSRNNDGEVIIGLSHYGGETSGAIKTYSRKRRKIMCSKPSCSCSAQTSFNGANNVCAIGGSNEHENGETATKILNNVEPAPVVEMGGSVIKEANLNLKGKLLILDVNGILADIAVDYPEAFKPDVVVSMKGVFKRPFCDEFLDFCFQRFDVGVWSSRTKKNVDKVTEFLMGDFKEKLLFCWDQSHCTDTGYKTVENRSKPLVLKELKRLWEKQVDDLPWEKGYYNETNTILLDDSPYKALRNPPYTAVFPFPFTFRDRRDTDLGPNGRLRSYLERLSEAENVQKFIQENPFGQRPITKSNLSWRFYSKIISDYSSHNQNSANDTPVAS